MLSTSEVFANKVLNADCNMNGIEEIQEVVRR